MSAFDRARHDAEELAALRQQLDRALAALRMVTPQAPPGHPARVEAERILEEIDGAYEALVRAAGAVA